MLDRRQFLLRAAGLAAVSALPACGGTDAPTDPATSAAPTAPGPPTTAQPSGGFPRTVRHELGTTRLETVPQRVVCGTDGAELCSLLALGERPVGFGQRNDPLRPWLSGRADGIDRYDLSSGETQYEHLAAWAPDLLLVQNGFATPETMPRFSEIAPTVATSFIDWRANLHQVGQAVGREEEARRLESQTDAAVVAVRDRLDPRAAGMVVNVISAFDDGTVYALNDQSPAGKVSAALGLARLPAQRVAGEASDQLSLERLDLVDGDLLLVQHYGEGDGTAQLRRSALWQRLDVVRNGRVVDLTEDESQQLYFDSVLTVEPNAVLLERLVRSALAGRA